MRNAYHMHYTLSFVHVYEALNEIILHFAYTRITKLFYCIYHL
jgi:hypothetical protein